MSSYNLPNTTPHVRKSVISGTLFCGVGYMIVVTLGDSKHLRVPSVGRHPPTAPPVLHPLNG